MNAINIIIPTGTKVMVILKREDEKPVIGRVVWSYDSQLNAGIFVGLARAKDGDATLVRNENINCISVLRAK